MRTKNRRHDNRKDRPAPIKRNVSKGRSDSSVDDDNWEEWSADDLDDLADFFTHANYR